MNIGMSLYRVGLVGSKATIVFKAGLGGGPWDVVWESWPDGQRRAGSPPPQRIAFNF